MKKTYRKIETIQAEQFDGSQEMIKKYRTRTCELVSSPVVKNEESKLYLLNIISQDLLFNAREVKIGDWVATGINGEHWAIKDDIFRETYTEAKSKWNKFKTRPITEEEREERPWVDEEYRFDCPVPDIGQKVLVTDGQWVGVDEWDDFAGTVGLLDYYDDDYDNLWWAPIPDLPKTEEK